MILLLTVSNGDACFLLQHQPKAGPVVRPGDQLRPLEGAAVPGRPQNSRHQVHEPDHPERE